MLGLELLAALIVKLRFFWLLAFLLSVAVNVGLYAPTVPVAGVPESFPVVSNVKPTGKAPVTTHLNGAVPPLAESVVEYTVFSVPEDSELVEITTGITATGAAPMVKAKIGVGLIAAPAASVIVKATLFRPADPTAGVPESVTVLVSVETAYVKPAGKPVTDQ